MATAVDVAPSSPTLHDINNNNNNNIDHAGPSSIISRSPSTSSLASTSTDVDDSTDISSSTEDDEEGVFFGGHDAREVQLVAKLSHSLPASPEPTKQQTTSPKHRRLSRPRVKKRDSREFLRRKTLLLSARVNSTPDKHTERKIWDGGFFEKGTPRDDEEDSEDEFSTPNLAKFRPSHSPAQTPADHSDVTLDFSKFNLSDVAPDSAKQAGQDGVEEDDSSDEDLGESDKENDASVASPSISRGRPSAVLAPLVVVGMDAATNTSDSEDVGGIDMGGLSLTDFADPNSSFEEDEAQSEGIDLGGESDGSGGDPSSPQQPIQAVVLVEQEEEEEEEEQVEEVEVTEDEGSLDEVDHGETDRLEDDVEEDEHDQEDEHVETNDLDDQPEDEHDQEHVHGDTDGSADHVEDDQYDEETEHEENEHQKEGVHDHGDQDPEDEQVQADEIQLEDHDQTDDHDEEDEREQEDEHASLDSIHSIHLDQVEQDEDVQPEEGESEQHPAVSTTEAEEPTEEELEQEQEEEDIAVDDDQVILEGNALEPATDVQASEEQSEEIVVEPPVDATPPTAAVEQPVTDDVLSTPNANAQTLPEAEQDKQPLRSDSSPDVNDSPLPVARAGPVVIPQVASHLAFSMRAETGSPYRPLPSPTKTIIQNDANATVHLGAIDSPPPSSTPLAQKLPSTLPPNEVASELPKSKIAKPTPTSGPSSLVTASVDRPKNLATSVTDKHSSTRAFAIRGQLDAAFVGRLGPPQRTVSASSGSSTSSQGRPPSRPGSGLSSRAPVAGPSRPRPQVTTAKPFSLSSSSRTARPAGSTIPQSKPASALSHAKPSTLPQSKSVPAKTVQVQKKPVVAPPKTALGLSRSTQSQAHPVRAPLAVRHAPPVFKQPAPVSKQPVAGRVGNLAGSINKPALSMSVPREKQISPPLQSVPVKRPLAASVGHGSTLARSVTSVSVGPSAPRPALGLPARLVRGGQPGSAPVFSLGVGGGGGTMSEAEYANRPVFESPRAKRPYGTPLTIKKTLGTPSRSANTPSRNGKIATPKAGQPLITPVQLFKPANVPTPLSAKKVAATPQPPVEPQERESEQPRGSSEDQGDVPMQLARPPCSPPADERPVTRSQSVSPTKPSTPSAALAPTAPTTSDEKEAESEKQVSRPKRATKPPQRLAKTATNSSSSASSVPGMSEKELKAATQRNTSKNEVYHCAIDRQIVRVNAPRPPSPTSKIRTTADREEEERKASRGLRAQRRSKEAGEGGQEDSEDDSPPLVERVERARGPGDDEDYVTPARPLKKTKIRHGEEKNVRWDRGLIVIRNDGRSVEKPKSASQQEKELKSALKMDDPIQLDRHGNVVEGTRPKETLKRQRVVVTAVFYEGEEPVPPPAPTSTGKGKKK